MKTRILFVCHGNICRSPMAQFVMQHLVEQRGVAEQFEIASAATSREELGNGVHPGTRAKLAEVGISCCADKRARQMTRNDYAVYDYLIGMDQHNLYNMKRICGDDVEHKIHLLLEYTNEAGEIADPWYTGNFDATYDDILRGCQGLLDLILNNHNK